MERLYLSNRFPYLDTDVVDFIFRSPFAGLHSNPFKPTPSQRIRSQFFYAHLINANRPELLRATTDHGFPPSDLLKPFSLLRIGPKYLYRRQVNKMRKYREFKTEEWTARYYSGKKAILKSASPIFSEKIIGEFESGEWIQRREAFARAASLKLWLQGIKR